MTKTKNESRLERAPKRVSALPIFTNATASADRSPASGTAGDLETVAKSTLGRIPKVKRPKQTPDPSHPVERFLKDKIEDVQSRTVAAVASSVRRVGASKALMKDAPKTKQPKRTPEEQRAEIERVAREHGADLSEEGFNEALRKVGGSPRAD